MMGNLTRDPEIRYTPAGKAVCNLSIANNRIYTKNGEKVQEVSFFDVEVWGAIAENCTKYLKKGSGIIVEGRLRQDRWEKDGQKHSRVVIVADTVQLLGGKRETKPADNLTEDEKYQMAKEFVNETRAGFVDNILF